MISHMRSRHTSGRSVFTPYGHEQYGFVQLGNVLATRCFLLIMIASFRKVKWVLEQPHNSFMPELPRFQTLLKMMQVGGFQIMFQRE